MQIGPLRVLVVDDHEIFRDGLRTLLESRRETIVAAEASSTREATILLDKVDFDLLVVDVTMPGSSGISLVRELRRRGSRQRILVLTMHAEADSAAEAFAAGADGFALKADSRAVLLDAIDRVVKGERFVAASLPRERIDRFLAAAPSAFDTWRPLSVLTVREREIFDLLSRGYGNEQMARELCISRRTVDTHRTHIFRKLGVHSIGELLRFGFRQQHVRDGAAADDLPQVADPAKSEPESTK